MAASAWGSIHLIVQVLGPRGHRSSHVGVPKHILHAQGLAVAWVGLPPCWPPRMYEAGLEGSKRGTEAAWTSPTQEARSQRMRLNVQHTAWGSTRSWLLETHSPAC